MAAQLKTNKETSLKVLLFAGPGEFSCFSERHLRGGSSLNPKLRIICF